MAQVKTIIFKKACDDFIRLQTKIGKVKEKLKNLNAENKGNIEIISGLSEGDIIVAEGLKKVRPRGKVNPINK